MKKSKEPGFATRAIHCGQEPDPLTGAVTVPIYPTSTYVQQGIGEHKGYEYSRVSNPTRARLETNLAALEGAVAARGFGSGMAAIHAIVCRWPTHSRDAAWHRVIHGVAIVFRRFELGNRPWA